MKCPKCNADLNEDAKFCHVCGYQIVAQETQAAPQETAPAQPTEPAQAATPTPPQQQAPVNENPMAGFDLKKIKISQFIISGIAFFGAIMVLLPWATSKITIFGYTSSASANGFNSVFGVFIFISFLALSAYAILGDQIIKLPVSIGGKVSLWTIIGILGFCLIDFVRLIAADYVRPGIGLFLAMGAGVALLLFELKVIKLKN